MACRVFRVRSTDTIRYACGKLSLSLKPFGSSVCNFFIQKSSRVSKVCRTCSRVMFWSVISSMIMSLKSSKEWFSSRKCWSMEIVPTFFESLRCLFSRLWAFWASTLPIYCLSLHSSHQAKYIACLDLHPVFCQISKRCFLVLLVKNFVWTTCWQHFVSGRLLQGEQPPDTPGFPGFPVTTLFRLIRVWPRISCRFFFRR